VTEDDKNNEHWKLIATFLNNAAVATVTVGALTPAAQQFFGLIPANIEPSAINTSAVICIGVGVVLHFVAHAILGGLK
jgi:hypothetical protein